MNLQTTLSQFAAYHIGARGETFNPVVIFDTVRQLNRLYTAKELRLMVIDSCPNQPGISEAIDTILNETYSDAAMSLNDYFKA